MPDQDWLLETKIRNNIGDVGREVANGIFRNLTGLFAVIVAPLVGNDNKIALLFEEGDLPAPSKPKFRETVQEDNGFALEWAEDFYRKVQAVTITNIARIRFQIC